MTFESFNEKFFNFVKKVTFPGFNPYDNRYSLSVKKVEGDLVYLEGKPFPNGDIETITIKYDKELNKAKLISHIRGSHKMLMRYNIDDKTLIDLKKLF